MIQAHLKDALSASIQIRDHELMSGLPEKNGGKDEGPNPHELIEAGLAACTILTCQLYANHKAWPLSSTIVKVEITSESKVKSTINRQIEFVGDLSNEQKLRLLEIANRCPIHRLLTSSIEITTELVTA